MTTRVVIVNWNAGQRLVRCLESLREHCGASATEIVVVDNDSTDGSAEKVETMSGLPLRVIRMGENTGFARACNVGAAECATDTILFLNPDTEFRDDAIAVSAALLQQPSVGVCGIRLLSSDGVTNRHCGREISLVGLAGHKILPLFGRRGIRRAIIMSDWDHESDANVGHVIGAYYHIRTDLHRRLAGFDERFFLYYEDFDYSTRVTRAGFQIRYTCRASAHHAGGGTSDRIKLKRLVYSTASRLRLINKYYGVGGTALGLGVLLGLEIPGRLGQRLIQLLRRKSEPQNP